MLKRWQRTLKIAAVPLFAAFVCLQLIPIFPADNPPIDPNRTIESQLEVNPNVKAILDRSCRDCHSYETQWPWYSHVAPAKWMISRDVHKARSIMNFSEWTEDAGVKLEKAVGMLIASCTDVTVRRMPKPEYLLLHRRAVLNQDDVNNFCGWSKQQSKVLIARKRARAGGGQ